MGTFGLFNVFKWESEVGEITQVTHLFQSPIFKESDSLNLQTCSFHLNFFWCCCFPLQLMEENHMWNSESEFWLQLKLCFKTSPLFCGLSTIMGVTILPVGFIGGKAFIGGTGTRSVMRLDLQLQLPPWSMNICPPSAFQGIASVQPQLRIVTASQIASLH